MLFACEKEEKPQPPPEVHHEAPAPDPVPANPFAKPPTSPVHEPFQTPHWEQAGSFKMNDSWSLFTWRDTANHI